MSMPVRFRGRLRPGPGFQFGFCRSEVSWLTSFRDMTYGPAEGRSAGLLTLTTSLSIGSFVEVAWKNGMVIFAMNVPSARVRLMMSLLPLT